MSFYPSPGALRWFTPLAVACGALFAAAVPAAGANTNVSVVNFSFSPAVVAIKPGDQVTWIWNSGITPHSTTSTNGLWDSGLHPTPNSFAFTFQNAGNFPYVCTIHAVMKGSVNVQGPNVSPTVSITAPTNNAVFAAPWSGTVTAGAADSDGTVTNVQFFAGTTALGSVSNPGATASLSFSNLAAGAYTLTAVATDNAGAKTTSAGIGVQVLNPGPILLSSPRRSSPNSFEFNYSATPGLAYVVQRSSQLSGGFVPVATNPANANIETFIDTNATADFDIYSVNLQPNP